MNELYLPKVGLLYKTKIEAIRKLLLSITSTVDPIFNYSLVTGEDPEQLIEMFIDGDPELRLHFFVDFTFIELKNILNHIKEKESDKLETSVNNVYQYIRFVFYDLIRDYKRHIKLYPNDFYWSISLDIKYCQETIERGFFLSGGPNKYEVSIKEYLFKSFDEILPLYPDNSNNEIKSFDEILTDKGKIDRSKAFKALQQYGIINDQGICSYKKGQHGIWKVFAAYLAMQKAGLINKTISDTQGMELFCAEIKTPKSIKTNKNKQSFNQTVTEIAAFLV